MECSNRGLSSDVLSHPIAYSIRVLVIFAILCLIAYWLSWCSGTTWHIALVIIAFLMGVPLRYHLKRLDDEYDEPNQTGMDWGNF
jgi:hypothetical protein